MKKLTFYLSLLLSCSLSLMAEEIPTAYYSPIEGLQDSILKSRLHEIVGGGVRVKYGSDDYHTTNSSTGEWKKGDFKAQATWGAFALTDVRSDGSVWDMYGAAKRYLAQKGQSSAGLEIEHCFPKSWWGAPTKESEIQKDMAYCDLYHLNPADAIANTNKSNYPPGYVINADKFDNGVFKMGKNSSYGDFFVFEPLDEYKGDFARAYFYIATAYEDRTWLDTYSNYLSNDSYLEFRPWLQQVLLEWHRLDPVSEKEINRQDAISNIQHNRNPYIDYPELVEYIWGNKKGEKVQLSNLVLTCSDAYICPISNNPTAFPATDISADGFVASWNNCGADSYQLNVFKIIETGSNDTLINLPLVKTDSIRANSNNVAWLNDDGTSSTFSTTDGGAAFYMSTTTVKKHFYISNITTADNAKLVVKCSVYNKGDKDAVLIVIANGDTLAQQEVGLDEQYYTFALPANTTNIDLSQKEIGTKANGYHRISMQQIYVLQGDYTQTIQPVEGYPMVINNLEHCVELDWKEGEVVYYNVTPQGSNTSNSVKVTAANLNPTNIEDTAENDFFAYKTFENGQVVIVMPNGEKINLLGIKLK